MKKTLLTIGLVALTGISSMAQGYFSLAGSARSAWDIFTPANSGLPKLGNTINIGILWAPSSATTALSGIQVGGTVTNTATTYLTNPWLAIQADLGGVWKLAVDNNTQNIIQPTTAANSGWAYTTTGGGSSIPVKDTASGQSYKMYVVGWDKTAGTLANALSIGAAVGWSSVFNYASVDSIGTPTSLTGSGFVPFGVNAVPEPTTFALGGLGVAAMLIARRRK
ncbi:MAG: PEP-CTERM sorting domain-containing protein [Verrucomicrobiota bacterium]